MVISLASFVVIATLLREFRTFVRKELSQAILSYILFDISQYPLSVSAYTSAEPPSLFMEKLPRQLLFTWLPAIGSCQALQMQYSIFSALTVAIGLYNPEDWPPITGNLADVCTVRDLRGKFWHQLIRRVCPGHVIMDRSLMTEAESNVPFRILKSFVPIRTGTLTSKYLQLYLAFMASGLLHHLGALNLPLSSRENDWNQLANFFMQPIAITIEDIVIHYGKKAGIKNHVSYSPWTPSCQQHTD